jgi:hypothetical protein
MSNKQSNFLLEIKDQECQSTKSYSTLKICQTLRPSSNVVLIIQRNKRRQQFRKSILANLNCVHSKRRKSSVSQQVIKLEGLVPNENPRCRSESFSRFQKYNGLTLRLIAPKIIRKNRVLPAFPSKDSPKIELQRYFLNSSKALVPQFNEEPATIVKPKSIKEMLFQRKKSDVFPKVQTNKEKLFHLNTEESDFSSGIKKYSKGYSLSCSNTPLLSAKCIKPLIPVTETMKTKSTKPNEYWDKYMKPNTISKYIKQKVKSIQISKFDPLPVSMTLKSCGRKIQTPKIHPSCDLNRNKRLKAIYVQV